MNGSLSAAGKASFRAETFNQDDSIALATAMGADLDRYLNKFAKGKEKTQESADDLLAGKYFKDDDKKTEEEKKDEKKPTDTNKKLNETLEENSEKDEDGNPVNKTDSNANLSSNVLKTQDAKQPATGSQDGKSNLPSDKANEGIGEANTAKDNGDTENNKALPGADKQDEQKYQVAAAIGLNITGHKANVTIKGDISAAAIEAASTNNGNFMTKGTGLAMSLAPKSNSLAAGVTVSVDNNEATVDTYGALKAVAASAAEGTEETGDIDLKATLTQNMDGKYKGLLAAQSIAGAVSGEEGKFSIAGSVVVVVDHAKTLVNVHGGTQDAPVQIKGDRITVQAYDKTKVAVRAGGVSVSKGSSAGVGAAIAVVYANDIVDVKIGDNVKIDGTSLTILAEKAVVDFSDFESAVGLDTFITDTTNVPKDDKDKVDKGIINLDKNPEGKDKVDDDATYKVEINVTTEDAVGMMDALNVLSSTNYYVEAIAGSIMSSSAKDSNVSVAGSIALLFFYNTVNASLGNNVTVNLSGATYTVYEDAKGNRYLVLGDDVYEENENGTIENAGFSKDVFGAAEEAEKETINEVEYTVYKVGDKTYYLGPDGKVYEKQNNKLTESKVTRAILNGKATEETETKGMLLNAKDDANVRILAGSLSAAPSKAGVGITIAALANEDEVTSAVGNNGTITITGGGYDQRATVTTDIMVVTVSASSP